MTVEVTDSNFDTVVLQSDKPVLVDFWAEWCGPCRVIGPLVKEISEEYGDKVLVTKLDVDSNPTITNKFNIRNIPTVLFFKNGKVVDKVIGAVAKSALVSKLNLLL